MNRRLIDETGIAAGLAALDGWRREGSTIGKSFTFADFRAAMEFMTRVADRAEALDHHPDWSNSWNRVEVSLTTHSAGGLTARDFALAAAMDEAAAAAG